MKFLYLILLCSIFPARSFSSPQKGDFLIISEPSKLSVFNQFEQTLSESELNGFPPYSPFLIVNRIESLGDQITEALRSKYQGKTFFLLLDGKGSLKGSNSQSYQKIFQNCQIINDTVLLKQTINAYQKFPSGGPITKCIADQPVIRIFKHSGSYYVFIPDKRQYGWLNSGTAVFKSISKTPIDSRTFSINDISGMIEARLTAANEIYNQYFGFFNEITLQQKSVPQWKLHNDGKTLKCILSSSVQINEQLQKSTRYVLQDIEQMLLGKPFSIQYTSGEITINPR